MAAATTYAGATVGICTTPQNSALADAAAFAALTYVPISNVGNVGPYGYTTNMISYPTLDQVLTVKAKGATDGGNWSIQVADIPTDTGQVAAAAAAIPGNVGNYAFQINLANGAKHYIRGPVGGPAYAGGGNEGFVTADFAVGVNQFAKSAPV